MMGLINCIGRQWRRLWYPIMPAERLAAIRIAVGVYSLYYLIPRGAMFERIARTPHDLFDPVGLARVLEAPLPPYILDILCPVTVLLAVAVTIGAGMRIVGPLFAVSLLALLSYRNSWSMVLHMHNALVVHASILAVSPSGDEWSIDRLFRKSRIPPAPSWRYGWAVQTVAASTVVVYLLCGVAKVSGPEGFAWAAGDALRSQVAVNAIRYDVLTEGGAAGLFRVIFSYEAVFLLMGVGTLVLELGAPFALTHRTLGRYWALATFGLHWGIYFTMGIKFRYQQSGAAFVAFIDAERLIDRVRRIGPSQARRSDRAPRVAVAPAAPSQ